MNKRQHIIAPVGKLNREGFAQLSHIQLLRIQEPHLSGRKIHLNAIMEQAVYTKNSSDATTRKKCLERHT